MRMKLFSLLCVVFFVAPMRAEDKPEFIRIKYEKDKVVAMQTAIVTYEKDGVTVDLVSAIHIGDREYYRTLNKKMETYDVLLYELVAPQGATPDRKKPSIVASLAKSFLELDSQVERINYEKPNFKHADLSFAQMKEAMAKRGETPLILALRVLADGLQKKNLPDPIEAKLAAEMSQAETPLERKRVYAKMLTSQVNNGSMAALKGTLIDDRNSAAMVVFKEQVSGGKKKIAIFYGAAHNADFDRRLRALGYTRKSVEWVTAWDLSDD